LVNVINECMLRMYTNRYFTKLNVTNQQYNIDMLKFCKLAWNQGIASKSKVIVNVTNLWTLCMGHLT
jgi:hypothetical protein